MYADTSTRSMQRAIDETYRRRAIQDDHNRRHGIVPRGIKKQVKDITDRVRSMAETRAPYLAQKKVMSKDEMFPGDKGPGDPDEGGGQEPGVREGCHAQR